MLSIKKFLFVFSLSLILAGCETYSVQPRLVADVTAYSSTSNFAGKKIHLSAYPVEKNSSLEWQSFRQKISNKFMLQGISITDLKSADYVAFVSYGIDDGTTSQYTYSTPIFGQTGGGTTTHSGSVNTYGSSSNYGYGTYSGTSTTMPTFGVVGSRINTASQTNYKRNLAIDMVTASSLESGNPEKVYEGRLKSTGYCGSIGEVIDEMIDALFIKFPSGSGRVTVPSVVNC
jgi:hypothetical protein